MRRTMQPTRLKLLNAQRQVTMGMANFNQKHWERLCSERVQYCERRCLTSMHFVMILGQEIDELLGVMATEQHARAVQIARGFGYESPQERQALCAWLQQESAQPTPVPDFANGRAGGLRPGLPAGLPGQH